MGCIALVKHMDAILFLNACTANSSPEGMANSINQMFKRTHAERLILTKVKQVLTQLISRQLQWETANMQYQSGDLHQIIAGTRFRLSGKSVLP